MPRLLWAMALGMTVWTALSAHEARAQTGFRCRSEVIENAPDVKALIEIGRQCLAAGRSNGMLTVASKIEYGFRGHPPDWRAAAQLYLEAADATESLPYNSLGARNWDGALSALALNFLNGNPDTGWPQDFALARKYQTRRIDRMKREPGAQEDLPYRYEELALIEAALAASRALTASFGGDLIDIAERFARQRLDQVMPERGGFTLVLVELGKDYSRDPGQYPRYGMLFDLYSRDALPPGFAGVCVVVSNGDVPENSMPRAGIWFSYATGRPFREPSGYFAGQYALSPSGSSPAAWLEWPWGVEPRSVIYEFRPLKDSRLCPPIM